MPYATRQGTIDFPKRKSIVRSKTQSVKDVPKTPESKILRTTTASSSARKAFHDSSSGITGREKELKQLTDFLLSHLESQTSGSLYISGLPGTGKTASVNYIIEKNSLSKKYQVVKINCTAFTSSNAVFKRICEGLKLKTVKTTEKDSVAAIERYLLRKHKIILLILDEIDQLESKSQSVLYKIFEWSSWEKSKLVLIGIANAMDLTDRNLPRLCAKVELKPILLHFAPYTKCEITEILKSRLTEAGADKIFAPGAIELIAAKVAGSSGDIRRALDLGKRVVEIAEQKNQKQQSDGTNSPKKTDANNVHKPLKRKIDENSSMNTPSKLQSLVDDIVDTVNCTDFNPSPTKRLKSRNSERVCLGEITPQKCNILSTSSPNRRTPGKSPRRQLTEFQSESENTTKEESRGKKSPFLVKSPLKSLKDEVALRRSPRKLQFDVDSKDVLTKEGSSGKQKSPFLAKSPLKSLKDEVALRRSPRKLQFDVDSKDVLTVVKNVFTSSKNFKSSEESIFPLHQKLLICTLLLIIKAGKKKDLNIGKLHQVYSKICAKHGLTAVDKSGFLFLCRQVEVSGVLQIGKGTGALAKVSLLWDESEVTNAIKDLNLLSSILNDTSCLT